MALALRNTQLHLLTVTVGPQPLSSLEHPAATAKGHQLRSSFRAPFSTTSHKGEGQGRKDPLKKGSPSPSTCKKDSELQRSTLHRHLCGNLMAPEDTSPHCSFPLPLPRASTPVISGGKSLREPP